MLIKCLRITYIYLVILIIFICKYIQKSIFKRHLTWKMGKKIVIASLSKSRRIYSLAAAVWEATLVSLVLVLVYYSGVFIEYAAFLPWLSYNFSGIYCVDMCIIWGIIACYMLLSNYTMLPNYNVTLIYHAMLVSVFYVRGW